MPSSLGPRRLALFCFRRDINSAPVEVPSRHSSPSFVLLVETVKQALDLLHIIQHPSARRRSTLCKR